GGLTPGGTGVGRPRRGASGRGPPTPGCPPERAARSSRGSSGPRRRSTPRPRARPRARGGSRSGRRPGALARPRPPGPAPLRRAAPTGETTAHGSTSSQDEPSVARKLLPGLVEELPVVQALVADVPRVILEELARLDVELLLGRQVVDDHALDRLPHAALVLRLDEAAPEQAFGDGVPDAPRDLLPASHPSSLPRRDPRTAQVRRRSTPPEALGPPACPR